MDYGGYTNDSEYLRELIRRDQEQKEKFRALKQAIQEGLDTGVSHRNLDEICRKPKRATKRGMSSFRFSRRADADLFEIAEYTITEHGFSAALRRNGERLNFRFGARSSKESFWYDIWTYSESLASKLAVWPILAH